MKTIDFRNMPAFNASSEILRQAVAAGLVEWTWGWDPESIVTPKVVEFIEDQFSISRAVNSDAAEKAGISPKSLHYRTNTRGLMTHPGEGPAYAEWSVELSRFVVPDGMVGVVKGFEQYLAFSVDQQDDFVASQSSRWGIPGPWHTGLGVVPDTFGRWHFRLRSLARISPNWWQVLGPTTLPDIPYTDVPFDDELWYPAGSPASQNIHLVIPAAHMLRVIYVSPESTVKFDVACKLKGYIQSDRSPESSFNVRTNW